MPDAEADDGAISDGDLEALFADIAEDAASLIAVSGGPDSTALLLLAARWRARRRRGPRLVALTVDHGLRPQAAAEARAVKALAARLKLAHRTVRWRGAKPTTGLQEAAREARYRLLAAAARREGARAILTAHTLEDQAETVLFRLARGSGLSGLAAMRRVTPLDPDGHPAPAAAGAGGLVLVRPLLGVSRARLLATLAAADIGFADDPTNRDPRFARPRWRALMPSLAKEGLDPRRLAQLAGRMARAHGALEQAVSEAAGRLSLPPPEPGRGMSTAAADRRRGAAAREIRLDARGFAALPLEIAIRLLGRAVTSVGGGGAELSQLERFAQALREGAAGVRFRRTLAGALVTGSGGSIAVTAAPPRKSGSLAPSAGAARARGKKAKFTNGR